MAKSGVRRTVIREWTSVAREQRQSKEQASAFAKKAAQAHSLPHNRRDPYDIIMAWLSPRIGRP
jgi:hypothetical protein